MEIFKEVNEITFINNPRETIPNGTLNLLKSLNKPIILITGGFNKAWSYKKTRK